MNDQTATEFFLRSDELSDVTDSSISTQALIDGNMISNSTDSLVHERVKELLERVHLTDSTANPLDIFDDISRTPQSEKLSPEMPATSRYINRHNGLISKGQHVGAEEIDPILSLLFNKIQVFLLRNKMSLDFLKIFKSYLNLLIETGLDPLNDYYFLALQNELSEGFEFNPMIEEILNKFLLRPENINMRLALFEHQQLLEDLRKSFTAWKLRSAMKVSLFRLENVWEEYLRRKFISLWVKRYHHCERDLVEQADDFKEFSLLSFGFDKCLAKHDTNSAKRGLADHFFLDHIFRRLKKRMKDLKLRAEEASTICDRRCLSISLRSLKLLQREYQYTSYDDNLKKRILRKLQLGLDVHKTMRARAAFTERLFLLAPYLDKWQKKTEKLAVHLESLAHLEQTFVKQKIFSILNEVTRRNKQEYQVVNKLDHLMVQYVFKNFWLRSYQQQMTLYNFWSFQNQHTIRKFIKCWRSRLAVNTQVRKLREGRVLRHTMLSWLLQLKLRKYLKSKEELSLKLNFEDWFFTATRCRKLHTFEHNNTSRKILIKWQDLFFKNRKSMNYARKHHERHLMDEVFGSWCERLSFVNKMKKKSEMYEKMRAVTAIKRGVHHMRDVIEFANQCDPLMISRGNISRYISFWKEAALSRRSKRLELLLDDYQLETDKTILQSHFNFWLQKIIFYRKECTDKSEYMYERNLERSLFGKILEKLAVRTSLLQLSDELRDKSVVLNTFYSWREHVKYLDDLSSKVEIDINKRNLALLLNCLNVWSMEIMKSKRNNETVQIFRKRWDRAGVRGLLLLWKNRADNSPKKLRRKNPHANVRDISLNGQIPVGPNLFTPIREISSKINTIPGSEGVKQYRIEAMKSHYSRVRRAIPSPIKSSTTLSSTVKKKFSEVNETSSWIPQYLPPPRISLERINKNLASKIDKINFERIPQVKLDAFVETNDTTDPMIDRSLLELDEETQYDESPTRRT